MIYIYIFKNLLARSPITNTQVSIPRLIRAISKNLFLNEISFRFKFFHIRCFDINKN